MAFGTRMAGVGPLAGAVLAAMALAGVAVFTVHTAGCADAGAYIQRGDQVELVGGCVDAADLPAAPGSDTAPAADPGAGIDRFRQVSP
ncbi:hypothetical protein [Actinokineospora sp.]|uniref:hypothetical protein n=1 Tax=Actinokineospora sp. TaxID=1872133 RepID=UPI004037A749